MTADAQSAAPGLPAAEELHPAPDPWPLCRRLAGRPYPLFLDSAGGPPELCRYSFLTADPFRVVRARGRRVAILDAGGGATEVRPSADPFLVLREQLDAFRQPAVPDLPPFQGGAAGLLGYDLCHHIERLPRPEFDEFALPELVVGLYDWVLAWDHHQGRAWLVSTGLPAGEPGERRRRAARRLRQVRDWLTRPEPAPPLSPYRPVRPRLASPVPGLPGLLSNFDRPRYLDTVTRAVEYVHAGDCFQVNVAQRLLYPARLPPLELYARLRQRNPAPFAGYFDAGDFAVASASPERFLRLDGDAVQTRPIKGTRPRGETPEQEAAHAAELLRSAKDRAENVMIVDLLRNDLGRVCRYGSVRVRQLCALETYRYVHHLVSEVTGRLRPECDVIDLLRAAFPGGSVTGAPKVRAMEIIAELERVARGPYCGSLGYLGFEGGLDTSILIRTFTSAGGWVQFPVGGGVVADSLPDLEYEETWHKARGALRALE